MKGHRYRTVELDYETGGVVWMWMGERRKKETLATFFELMSAEERAAVETVALDQRHPHIRAGPAWLPHARVVYDLYHMADNDRPKVLDKVRIGAYRRAETREERRWIKGGRYQLYGNLVSELREYGVEVDVHHPRVDPEEEQAEYGLDLFPDPAKATCDGIILAVANGHLHDRGIAALRRHGASGHVSFDLKSMFDAGASDLRQ